MANRKSSTILIPGRAFDAKGNRLGRGNGGYDKWIAEQRERRLDAIDRHCA